MFGRVLGCSCVCCAILSYIMVADIREHFGIVCAILSYILVADIREHFGIVARIFGNVFA